MRALKTPPRLDNDTGSAMTEAVLRIEGLTKSFGGLVAVDQVSYQLPGGDLRAIIGPNGAGKTTFFNLISGMLSADAGTIIFHGEDITGKPPHIISQRGIARTLQVKSVFNGLSVYENVWIAAHARSGFLHPLRAAMSYRETRETVESVLEDVGIANLRNEQAGSLSYGDVALLELAIALAMKPKLLLLDEPVAGMSPEETERTVAKIGDLSRRVDLILIEHDMEVVFGVADVITVMNQGMILCEGKPSEIASDARVQEAYLGTPEDEA